MGMPLPSTQPLTPAQIYAEAMTDAAQAREAALQLAEQRITLDAELDAHVQVLKSNEATMTSPLVDADGFPSSTIDVVAVRTARARIIALRNDREAIEKQLRDLLDVALARRQNGIESEDTTNGTANGRAAGAGDVAMAHVPGTNGALSIGVPVRQDGDDGAWSEVGGLSAFARVNAVAADSPAARANLRIGDEVLQFSHLTAATAHQSAARRDLANVATVVREGEEVSVLVVRRDGAEGTTGSTIKRLRLTPTSAWGGRGLLGCHLVPL